MQQPVTQSIYELFNGRIQFVVPVYQRAYVWNEEENWSVLWDDIADTANRYLQDPERGHEHMHFLGPIVLMQQHFEPGGVDQRLVIDGQQRLTTLQVLLAALRTVAHRRGEDHIDEELRALTENRGRTAVGPLQYKIRPSRRDRSGFMSVMDEGADGSRHRLNDAHDYFVGRIEEWIDEEPGPDRIDTIRVAIDGLLYVVSINLDENDNAQVIFETLNARGTGLGALDLAKNATFLQAEREGADTADLHDQHWEPTFEADDYWAEEVRQGRQKRDRADWFMMHWLGMELGEVVRVDKLFDTYRRKILRGEDRVSVDELIPQLCSDAQTMRSFDDFDPSTPEALFFSRLNVMDTTTLLPLALLLFRSPEVSREVRQRGLRALESWLVRRAILRYTTRNYNRTLTSLIKSVKEDLTNADTAIVSELRASEAATALWPDDETVRDRLETNDLYGYISQARIRMLLEACELDMRDPSKSESIDLPASLTIEHAMPVSWERHWPLAGDTEEQREDRETHINRLGNLTLITQGLNSSMSNAAWQAVSQGEYSKRRELANRSVLLINQRLCHNETWSEDLIDERGKDLVDRIVRTWPGPTDDYWD